MKKTDPRFQEKYKHLLDDNGKATFDDIGGPVFEEYITDRLTWEPPSRSSSGPNNMPSILMLLCYAMVIPFICIIAYLLQ